MKRGEVIRRLRSLASEATDLADAIEHASESQASASSSSDASAGGEAFRGIPMSSKYDGRCAVCGQGYAIGTQIVYRRSDKRAAHLGCGVADTRRGQR